MGAGPGRGLSSLFASGGRRLSWAGARGRPPVIREDRAYQIAAARFNAAQFAEAERAFRQIEPSPESWAGLWAPYMVGRSIVWQSRTFLGDEEGYRTLLRKAQVALEAVLRRDDLAVTHDAARHLLIRVLALTDQEAAARLLGLRLSSPLRAGSRVQDWEQYSSLLFHNTRQIEDYRPKLKPHGELRKLGVRDALTDWILTFQSQDEAAYEHALRRWRETGSTAWLVACLSKATAESAAAPRLLEAAAQLPPGPAWASVQFYSARLLAARAEREQARVVLDRLLPQIASRSSSWNRALALRAELGRTVRETLQFGIRRPASFAVLPSAGGPSAPWAWNTWDARHLGRMLRYEPMLTPAAADILNSAVPLTRFAALIAEDHGLPEPIRRDIVIAAWVRAVLLEKIDLAFNVAAEVAKVAEETGSDMARYRASKPADRRFVAVAILLKFPGMSVRLYPGIGRAAPLEELHLSGFNWWWWTLRGEIEPTPPEAAAVDWLTASESAEAKREWAQIVALGNGASWLYKTTYERCRAASPPSDCAEALYRTVVSRDWIDYPHGMQYLPYEIYDIAGYESSELLTRRFARTLWAQLVEKDGADGVNAWKHEYLPFRLSAPYPR